MNEEMMLSTPLSEFDAVQVTTDAEYKDASYMLRVLKGLEKEIKAHYAPLKKAAHAAHRAVTTSEKEKLQPVVDVEARIKGMMAAWRASREAEERKRAAEAAEALLAAREQYANALESSGDLAAATTVRDEVTVVAEPAPLPKTEGISVRRVWKWELLDGGAVDREYLMVDRQTIDNIVRNEGPSAEEIVGKGSIRVYQAEITAVRS